MAMMFGSDEFSELPIDFGNFEKPKPRYGDVALTVPCEDCHCEIAIKFDPRYVGVFELINCPLCGKQLAWFTPIHVIQRSK